MACWIVADALAYRAAADTSEQDQQHIADQQGNAATLEHRQLQAGVASGITALQADQTVLSARLTLAVDREAQLTSIVQLYRALGGGWQPCCALLCMRAPGRPPDLHAVDLAQFQPAVAPDMGSCEAASSARR